MTGFLVIMTSSRPILLLGNLLRSIILLKRYYFLGGGRSMAPPRDEFLELVASLIGRSASGIEYRGDSDNAGSKISAQQPSTSFSIEETYTSAKNSSATTISTNVKSLGEINNTIEDLLGSDDSEDIDDPGPIFEALKARGDIVSWGDDGGPKNLRKPISQPLQNIIFNKAAGKTAAQTHNDIADRYRQVVEEQIKTQIAKRHYYERKTELVDEKLKRLRDERDFV
ncbi:uncharacterized protein [Prorops nasuta]|uniref:uncharacterized protein n=1 Tax=Prorops nasuta TaxID=863751 RepID=UPI0034CF81A4